MILRFQSVHCGDKCKIYHKGELPSDLTLLSFLGVPIHRNTRSCVHMWKPEDNIVYLFSHFPP